MENNWKTGSRTAGAIEDENDQSVALALEPKLGSDLFQEIRSLSPRASSVKGGPYCDAGTAFAMTKVDAGWGA